ncbi:MAG: hypothetical protein HXL26_03000 [Porphyromonadaceae bacterium]|nr:hypothetical protein [Porphyromonadaceae bacterium]
MTRDELYSYLRDPRQLSAATLEPIRQLSEAYPYCSTFTFLYLYNLSVAEDVRYASELRRLAVLLPDRERLFRLVEGDRLSVELPEPEDPATDSFDLIDHFLDAALTSGEDLPTGLQLETAALREEYFAGEEELSETAALSALLPERTPAESAASAASSLLEDALRSSSLEAPSTASEDAAPIASAAAPLGAEPTVPSVRTSSPQPSPSVPSEPSARPSLEAELEESLLSETLSKIYIQQQHYDKALRIIRALSLNYPEKNRFFADQIRFLERLIANNKSKQ